MHDAGTDRAGGRRGHGRSRPSGVCVHRRRRPAARVFHGPFPHDRGGDVLPQRRARTGESHPLGRADASYRCASPAAIRSACPARAAEVLGKAGLRAGDTILISSNTGINTVPVEAALYAKERGLTVVCVTSKKISRTPASRRAGGKAPV